MMRRTVILQVGKELGETVRLTGIAAQQILT